MHFQFIFVREEFMTIHVLGAVGAVNDRINSFRIALFAHEINAPTNCTLRSAGSGRFKKTNFKTNKREAKKDERRNDAPVSPQKWYV